ncbi:cryptochrome/photolyase family protein [Leucothrix arctica]|uniref:Cryptochrome/photolyase family protein n=1 Tax=Leucothrix arctica TaxID=1481894 RepID=A0A317CM68_9GAMM|nr:cryptochrome/photolyase family protein [Leucothrix arctica]PWQ99628.1 cryptochrome/photolyase family protein [Leucothrix arctica]
MSSHYQTLRLILGDQLNANHHWYQQKDPSVLYVIAELKQEATYTKHHIQKLCAFFSAMEQFAGALNKSGHEVTHLTLDDTADFADFPELIQHLCLQHDVASVEYQRPDEYRLLAQMRGMSLNSKDTSSLTVTEVDTEHFLVGFDEIDDYFTKDKHHKMEFFYRKMRKRFDVLMEGDKPVGEQWNFDGDNRNKLKPQDIVEVPAPLLFERDVTAIRQRLEKHNIPSMGEMTEHLLWPTTRRESLELLSFFCEHCLPNFGRFQDAMTGNSEHQWSLYHSRLSFSINSKMLHPLQVINEAISHFERSEGKISLSQIEGFVRQILGWREYIRGVYWANMPEYRDKNSLDAQQSLPSYFWTADTKMNCMKQSIKQSLDYAYAHHIQRLMVTGNFCLLTGINPDEVDEWYLGIYIDALEWVEMPNTRGMSQFADGGIVATKAYSAGGNYINKMSDYCKYCHYKIKEKTGESACPFNSLYWGFMVRHRERFEKNPRIGMVYRQWDKQEDSAQTAVIERANWCIENLESL